MSFTHRTPLLIAAVLAVSASASAHVSVNSPGFAKKSALLNFSIGHGCEGLDTIKVDVTIPPEITALRAAPSPNWALPTIVKDDAEAITNVIWEKEEFHETDDLYYVMTIRTTLPDTPFTTLYFPTTQTCPGPDGEMITSAWAALPGDPKLPDGTDPPPAPALTILPPRVPGWNKYTVPVDLADMKMFADALIVWSGDAAYSANPVTAEQIAAEKDVTALETIAAGDEIWVKY